MPKMPKEHAYTDSGFDRSIPKHPEGSHTNAGHPGETLRMREDGNRIGSDHPIDAKRPAVLSHNPEKPGQHDYPGQTIGMGAKTHGYRHAVHQRHGALRMSGNKNAHQIGKRK